MRSCQRFPFLGLLMMMMGPPTVLSASNTQRLRGGGGKPPSWRSLAGPTLTTTNCNVIRLDDYQAELQLVYSYLVEFAAGGSRSLHGLEEAITHAVAQALDSCDEMDRPLYKVRTNTRHVFSKDDFCAPLIDGDTCHVVTGATAILLDSKSAHVQEKAYRTISKGLNNTDFVDQFASSVVRAQFLESLRESLVSSPEPDNTTPPGSVTATVAVAAASVSFIVASIFCYGLMRREHRHHPEPSVRHKNRSIRKSGRTVVSNPIGIKSRRQFVRLEELAASPATFVTAGFSVSPREYTPSITWSISDITSDSASLRSSVSRTTSKLERIEEADEEADDEYECDDYEDEEGSSDMVYQPRVPLAMSITHLYGESTSLQKSTFDCVDLEDEPIDFSELQGCRYVEDEDYGFRMVTPDSFEELERNRFVPFMTEVDDLQISLDDEDDDDPYEPLPPLLGELAVAMSPKVGTDEDSLSLQTLKDIPESNVHTNAEPKASKKEVDKNASEALLKVEVRNGMKRLDVSACSDPDVEDRQAEDNPKFVVEYTGDIQQILVSDDRQVKRGPHEVHNIIEGDTDMNATARSTSNYSPLETEANAPTVEEAAVNLECPQTPKENRDEDADPEMFWTPSQQMNEMHDETDITAVDVSIQDNHLQEWV